MNQIKVFYQNGDDKFIFWIHGGFTVESLNEIENELNDPECQILFIEDGEYLLNVHWEKEQRGNYGMIELEGYWDFEVIEITPHGIDTNDTKD